MEFEINSKEFENLLSTTVLAIPARNPIETLEYFLFSIKNSNLLIQGTDNTNKVCAEVVNIKDTGKEIEFLVPAKLLYDFVKTISDKLIKFKIEEEANNIQITFNNSEYNISYLPKDEYHEMPEINSEKIYKFNGASLKRALELTSFAVSTDEVRPALSGVLFEFTEDGLNVVATDGHRLVKYTDLNKKNESQEQFVLPGKAISLLTRSLTDGPVELTLNNSEMTFKTINNTITTRVISEKYPNYKGVIPLQNEKLMSINTAELKNAVRRSMLFGSQLNGSQVKLDFEQDLLTVSANDSTRGRSATEKLPCKYSDEPMAIGFQADYFSEMLSHIESEEVILKINQPTKAVIIKPSSVPEGEELLLLIMPIRLNS